MYELRCCDGFSIKCQVEAHVLKHLRFRWWFSVFWGCSTFREGVMTCKGGPLEVDIVSVCAHVVYSQVCADVNVCIYVWRGQSLISGVFFSPFPPYDLDKVSPQLSGLCSALSSGSNPLVPNLPRCEVATNSCICSLSHISLHTGMNSFFAELCLPGLW